MSGRKGAGLVARLLARVGGRAGGRGDAPLSPSARAEVDEELRFHLEGRARELEETGMTPDEARREALRRFGDLVEVERVCSRYTEEVNRRRGWQAGLGALFQDARIAARSLAARPGFTLPVVVTLALAIGATTAVFSLVDGVLLRPLPVPEPEALVRVYQDFPSGFRLSLSDADLLGLRERARTLASVGGVRLGEVALGGVGSPEWTRTAFTSGGFMQAVGVAPAVGRPIQAADERPGAARVVVLGASMGERLFGPGAAALGRSVTLDGTPHEVVGVLPRGTRELAGLQAEVWAAMALDTPSRRGPFGMFVVARLADGVAPEAVADDLGRVSREVFDLWSPGSQGARATYTPVRLLDVMVGPVRRILVVLQAAVAVVLLIAVANVANLVLSRTSTREGELAVRAALGAGRGRLGRMLLVESLLLAAAGGAAGVLLAVLGVEVFRSTLPALPRMAGVGVDGRALAVTAGVTLLAGVLLGLAPLASARRHDQGAATLRAGGDRGTTAGRRTRTVRAGLVAAQFALAVPVLTAAGLLAETLLHLQASDTGVDARGVTAVRVARLESGGSDGERLAFWDDVARRVAAVPSVAGFALSEGLPPDDPGHTNNFDLIDRPVPEGTVEPNAAWWAVDESFFDVLGVERVEGRLFGRDDGPDGRPVAVVTRAWARRYYPGESAVGRTMIEGGCDACIPTEVVGVVEDLRFGGPGESAETVLVPFRQWLPSRGWLTFRSRGDDAAALAAVREALAAVDPTLPLDAVTTVQARLEGTLATPRHWATLVGTFAAAAGALAAVGVFGVLSYLVSRQGREIGVRMALGADRGRVLGMVVRRGMLQAGIGVAVGIAAALASGRLLQGLLFGVEPGDPVVLAGCVAALLMVALGACVVPAWRATRVDVVDAVSS